MTSEMCPSCREVRELSLTSTTTTETQSDGSRLTIRTDTYHCSVCRMFVRSEIRREPAPGGRAG